MIACYLMVSRLGEFYALAVVFGTAYGGVMPLYAVLAREYFGQRIDGHGVRRHDHGLQPRHGVRPVGGRTDLRRLQQLYAWLYIGALDVALGAVAVAFTFPARPQARAAAAGVRGRTSPPTLCVKA